MLETIIDYQNAKFENLSYFNKVFGRAETITVNSKFAPHHYIGNGEYVNVSDFDEYGGSLYWRKTGKVTITDISETSLIGSRKLVEVNIPMRIVVTIPKAKLLSDDAYTAERVANTLIRTIQENNITLKNEISARLLVFEITGWEDNAQEVKKQEYSGRDISPEWVYLSMDINISIQADASCLSKECYYDDTYTNAFNTYWNALTVENGGIEVNGALYNITTAKLKSAINSFFITGATDGWLADMIYMYLFIGGTGATHAVNAITPGTKNLIFVGSPTHDKFGFLCDGISDYANIGNNPSTDGITLTSAGLTAKSHASTADGTNQDLMGAQNSAAQREILLNLSVNLEFCSAFDITNSITSTSPLCNCVLTETRTSATDYNLYQNGSLLGTSVVPVAGSIPTMSDFIMARNSVLGAVGYRRGYGQFAAKHLGLTAAKVSSFHTAVNTLQTTLNR